MNKMLTVRVDPVCCPVGQVVPKYLGAMYFDHVNHLFYQARGTTAMDWRLVTPEEMVGSFVKVWRYFKGLPKDDPKDHAAREFALDDEAVRKTMALSGVDVHRGESWTTHAGVEVMQARVGLRRAAGLIMFVGFAPAPARPHAMPDGAGFRVYGGLVRFGQVEMPLELPATVAFRVEVSEGRAVGYVNDEKVAAAEVNAPFPREPVVALFEYGDGPRPFEAGYEMALKRSQERR